MNRSFERESYLFDLLACAIEHCGYGWFDVLEWSWDEDKPAEAFAVIQDQEEGDQFRVTIDIMAKGLRVIRESYPRGEQGRLWTRDGKLLGFGGKARKRLILSDRTNGDDGDYDVIGALAALECGLFGEVVYS